MTFSSCLLQRMVDDVANEGWSCCDGFIDPELSLRLRDDAAALHRSGEFKPAAVGAGEGRAVRHEVRSDEICWRLDTSSAPLSGACARFEERRASGCLQRRSQ